MRISIIIVAYINYIDLQKTLDSISNYNDIGNLLEVIVVDNSPDDQKITTNIQQNNWSFRYTYISSDNRGFGAGNNLGTKIARGDIIGFINPDIIFISPIFKRILKEFDNNPNTAMIGGRLLKENRKFNSSFKYDFGYGILIKQMNKIMNFIGAFNENKMYIEGADIFIRKKVFDEAGKFDEQFFMYYEEADLIRRVKEKTNGKVRFLRDIKMIHLENGSTPVSDKTTMIEIESCRKYANKYGLNASKKIKADLNYLKLKSLIFKILRSENKFDSKIKIYEEELRKYN